MPLTPEERQAAVVYVVGSVEDNFIADRVYTDKEAAIAYCKKRRNTKHVWSVMEAPIGAEWGDWTEVFSERKLQCH